MDRAMILGVGAILIRMTWAAGSLGPVVCDPAFDHVQQAGIVGDDALIPDAASGASGPGAVPSGMDWGAIPTPSPAPRPGTEYEHGSRGDVDWGVDRLVASLPGDLFRARLSVDHAANGDIYIGVLSWVGAPLDSFHVYRSTDQGVSWAGWLTAANFSGDDTIVDGQVLVGPGANPWVYLFTLYATSAGGLFAYRVRADGSGGTWLQIAGGDTVRDFWVDRNIETPETYFLTYRRGAAPFPALALLASVDSGMTWIRGRYVSSSAFGRPSVAAGGSGYVYLTFLDTDTSRLIVVRYTNNLNNPVRVFRTIDSVAGDFSMEPCVAGARTSPGDSQPAWVLNRHRHTNGNYDIHVSTTTDGGMNWVSAPWPIANVAHTPCDFRFPMLRYSYDYHDKLVAGIAILYGFQFDSLYTGWADAASPLTWNQPQQVNDYDVTGEVNSAIDICDSAGGDVIVYRQYGSGNIWADFWDNATGVSELTGPALAGLHFSVLPNPVPSLARFRYELSAPARVELGVYDLSGKLVSRVSSGFQVAGNHSLTWDVHGIPSGVYLARIRVGGTTSTTRFVVTR